MQLLVELSHEPQVLWRKAGLIWKCRSQITGKLLHHRLTPTQSFLPLNDCFSDIPVQLDELTVHGTRRSDLRRANTVPQFCNKCCIFSESAFRHFFRTLFHIAHRQTINSLARRGGLGNYAASLFVYEVAKLCFDPTRHRVEGHSHFFSIVTCHHISTQFLKDHWSQLPSTRYLNSLLVGRVSILRSNKTFPAHS